MRNDNLYMRINYTDKAMVETSTSKKKYDLLKTQKESSKYLLAGGVLNKNKGSIMFKASNMEEAMSFAKNNILTKNKGSNLKELNRDIIILPKKFSI